MATFSRQAALVLAIAFTAGTAGFWVARWMPRTAAPAAPTSAASAATADARIEGQKAPAITLPDTDGRSRTLAEWSGKWVLVNFWATWCAPCMHEIPVLIAAQNRYQAAGLQVLGVAMDDVDAVRSLMQQRGFNYPSMVGDEAVQGLMEQFGNALGALPYSVLVDPSGVIRYVELGGLDETKLTAVMQKFLSH